MKTSVRLLLMGLLLLSLSTWLSCGSGGGVASEPASSAASVALTEHNLTLGAGETHQFTAIVTGTSNTNVTWKLSGCTGDTCGTISPSGLYKAPSVVSDEATVTVIATAQADWTKDDLASVELMPPTILISPTDAWIPPGTSQTFTASIRYDSRNAGVNWTLGPACANNCGSLSNITPDSVTYNAPATTPDPPTMTLTATSVADPSKKAERMINIAAAGGMTEGDYAFIFNGWETPITNGYYWMFEFIAAGRFHADAQGNITSGVEDVNSRLGIYQSVPFTGTYSVGADGRGSFAISTAQGTATYHMVLDVSKKKGMFIRYDNANPDSPVFGTGSFEMQDPGAFSLSALAGPYAFGVFGTHEANRLAAVGRFIADASGAFSSGQADATLQVYVGSRPQASSTGLELTGTLNAPSSGTGRGTATLNWGAPYNFAYYIVSNQKIWLVQTDQRNSTNPVLSGEFRRQSGPFSAASFNKPAIFSMAGVNRSNYGDFYVNGAVGQMVPDKSGSMTGTFDDNQGSTNEAFTGSYTMAPNGRATLPLKRVLGSTDAYVAYFFNENQAFLMQTSGTDVLFGQLKPQAAGPFSEASITGTYRTSTGAPASEQAENDCGLTTFDGMGSLTSTMDVNKFGNPTHLEFDGTYTVAPNGRGTLTFSSPAGGTAVFWLVSPTEVAGVGAVTDPSGFWRTLLTYEE